MSNQKTILRPPPSWWGGWCRVEVWFCCLLFITVPCEEARSVSELACRPWPSTVTELALCIFPRLDWLERESFLSVDCLSWGGRGGVKGQSVSVQNNCPLEQKSHFIIGTDSGLVQKKKKPANTIGVFLHEGLTLWCFFKTAISAYNRRIYYYNLHCHKQ